MNVLCFLSSEVVAAEEDITSSKIDQETSTFTYQHSSDKISRSQTTGSSRRSQHHKRRQCNVKIVDCKQRIIAPEEI